jgi:hypothetical protein
MRAQHEVDGGGLKSGGQGSGTDSGAEEAERSRAEQVLGEEEERKGDPGTRLQNSKITGSL